LVLNSVLFWKFFLSSSSSSSLFYYHPNDSLVCIVTGYGLNDRGVGVRIPEGSRIFSSPRRPDRLWGPPSLLSDGYKELFPFPVGKAEGTW
jgi:hypothetical protein